MAHGVDRTLVYRRYPEVEETPPRFFDFGGRGPWRPDFSVGSAPYHVHTLTVGFCGRVYPVLELWPGPYTPLAPGKAERAARRLAYAAADVGRFVRDHFPHLLACYEAGEGRRRDWRNQLPEAYCRPAVERFFEWTAKPDVRAKHVTLFEARRCPVFVAARRDYDYSKPFKDRKQVTVTAWNAALKPVEFYRLFDAHAAYQEIAQWLGNQAEPRKPLPTLPETWMRDIKGFDKYSFRKDPTSPKRRRTL